MQLEQLGNDALAMMDFPVTFQGTSPLESYLMANNETSKNLFNTSFPQNLTTTYGKNDNLKYSSKVYFSNSTTGVHNYTFTDYNSSTSTGREHTVRATRFVHLKSSVYNHTVEMENRDQAVLFEVLLWRD